MISTGFFIALLMSCFILILLSLFAVDNNILFGCFVGVDAAIILVVMIGCVSILIGKLQVWETDKLHASMSTKCFQVGHEQKCGVFDISTDNYRYVSDGNKLTVYAK